MKTLLKALLFSFILGSLLFMVPPVNNFLMAQITTTPVEPFSLVSRVGGCSGATIVLKLNDNSFDRGMALGNYTFNFVGPVCSYIDFASDSTVLKSTLAKTGASDGAWRFVYISEEAPSCATHTMKIYDRQTYTIKTATINTPCTQINYTDGAYNPKQIAADIAAAEPNRWGANTVPLAAPNLCTSTTPVTGNLILSVEKESPIYQDVVLEVYNTFSLGRVLIKSVTGAASYSSSGSWGSSSFGGSSPSGTIYFYDGNKLTAEVRISGNNISHTFSPEIYATRHSVAMNRGYVTTLSMSYSTGTMTSIPPELKTASFQVSDKDGIKNVGTVDSLFPGALTPDPTGVVRIKRASISTASHEVKMGFSTPFNSQYTIEGAVTSSTPIMVCKDNNGTGGFGDNTCDVNQCSTTIVPLPAPTPTPAPTTATPTTTTKPTPTTTPITTSVPELNDGVSGILETYNASPSSTSELRMRALFDYFNTVLPAL